MNTEINNIIPILEEEYQSILLGIFPKDTTLTIIALYDDTKLKENTKLELRKSNDIYKPKDNEVIVYTVDTSERIEKEPLAIMLKHSLIDDNDFCLTDFKANASSIIDDLAKDEALEMFNEFIKPELTRVLSFFYLN